jgi:peptide/nickel transport system permease protein
VGPDAVLDAASPSRPVPPGQAAGPRAAADRSRAARLVGAGVLFAAGLVAVLLATTRVLDGPTWTKAVLLLGGLVLAWLGLDQVAKAIWGADFPTGSALAAAWLGLVVLAAVLADALPLAESRKASRALREPVLAGPHLFSHHPLGTDRQGLDLLGGVIYGARVSLAVGLGATIIGLAIGGTIGLVAGYRGGLADRIVGLQTDTMLAFPPLVLLLGLVTVLHASDTNVTIGLAILGIPIYIRLARANTLAIAQREYVFAARAMGASDRRVVLREVLPNAAPPLLSYGMVIVAVLIVAEASLSYLGLSIQRPNPTWGNLIAAGQDSFQRHPHTVLVPGIVMFVTIFSLNRVGDRVRARWTSEREETVL